MLTLPRSPVVVRSILRIAWLSRSLTKSATAVGAPGRDEGEEEEEEEESCSCSARCEGAENLAARAGPSANPEGPNAPPGCTSRAPAASSMSAAPAPGDGLPAEDDDDAGVGFSSACSARVGTSGFEPAVAVAAEVDPRDGASIAVVDELRSAPPPPHNVATRTPTLRAHAQEHTQSHNKMSERTLEARAARFSSQRAVHRDAARCRAVNERREQWGSILERSRAWSVELQQGTVGQESGS